MKRLIENEENVEYGIIGEEICMGDHKVNPKLKNNECYK
jgi:hypothetical protein